MGMLRVRSMPIGGFLWPKFRTCSEPRGVRKPSTSSFSPSVSIISPMSSKTPESGPRSRVSGLQSVSLPRPSAFGATAAVRTAVSSVWVIRGLRSSGASRKCSTRATMEGGAMPVFMQPARVLSQVRSRAVVPGGPPWCAKGVAAKFSTYAPSSSLFTTPCKYSRSCARRRRVCHVSNTFPCRLLRLHVMMYQVCPSTSS
mmetsp:Transcript_104899/g.295487  ORF Transcript_104899/g.295487 Transcript_104899/m.295487 type:complete len:200 (+) Transcript_104899:718-1317(+)